MSGRSCPPGGCACCVGSRHLTPRPVDNRPGLSALRRRVGTQGSFFGSMLAGIGDEPALDGLTTRDLDDPTIALADSWACVLDVLTFYQERIANEGYLRTATERRSVAELAAEIGYRLGPGVAASARLAFTLETAVGSPTETTIPVGTKVQSVPGPGEIPQMFETTREIVARADRSSVRARRFSSSVVRSDGTHLAGAATGLEPGDFLLLVFRMFEKREHAEGRRLVPVRLTRVETDEANGLTQVHWVLPTEDSTPVPTDPVAGVRVFAFRTRARLFGHNAPDWSAMTEAVREAYETRYDAHDSQDWPGLSLKKVGTGKGRENAPGVVYLDTTYPRVTAGSRAVLWSPDHVFAALVLEVADDSRTDFGFSGKSTRVSFYPPQDPGKKDSPVNPPGKPLPTGVGVEAFESAVRQTTFFGEEVELPLAPGVPLGTPVEGDTVTLDVALDPKPRVGDAVAVSETRAGELAPFQQEVVIVDRVEDDAGRTKLVFTAALKNRYSRADVRFNLNVVDATHGESRREVLGSGDGSHPFQAFVLKEKPLTYVPSAAPPGRASTLSLRVDGVRWDEVRSLYAQPAAARVFTTEIADGGAVTIRTGDGVEGRRLPTGADNVEAEYRTGTGIGGLVPAGRLSLLMSPPLGVKSVVNPEPAAGAADPESREDGRTRAPLTVRTFDRIVSVRDFERHAALFPGVAKARADLLWSGESRVVVLTVALAADAEYRHASATARALVASVKAAGDPYVPFAVVRRSERRFHGSAKLRVAPDRRFADVKAACLARLADEFSFERAVLAQSVPRGRLLAVLQSVAGVEGVDMDTLAFVSPPAKPGDPAVAERLDAEPARRGEGGTFLGADLIVLAPDGFKVEEMPR